MGNSYFSSADETEITLESEAIGDAVPSSIALSESDFPRLPAGITTAVPHL